MQTVIYIVIMAGVTYLIRMLPIMVFRRKIKSQVVLLIGFISNL